MSKKDNLKNISDLVTNCTDCELYKNRINPVFGNGSLDTNLIFIGEAPGHNEDIQGIPFVGRAGKILDDLLNSIGLNRKDIYITNILKCRPPKNRNPFKSEIENCKKYLNKQMEIIKPKIIATLGNFATKYIFGIFGLNYDKISNIHGKSMKIKTNYGSITIIPLYHPASATYDPNKKFILLEDFKIIKKNLRR